MAKRRRGRKPKISATLAIVIVILILIIVIAAVAVYFVKPDLYHKYLGLGEHTFGEWTEVAATCGKQGKRTRECTVCGETEEVSIPATGEHNFNAQGVCTVCGQSNLIGSAEGAAASQFSVHLIDLGRYAGDSIYIKAGGNDILIDAGARAESADLICDYIDDYVTDGKLEYVIATHADQDHIAAFAGNASGSTRTGVLYRFNVGTFIRFDNVDDDKKDKADNLNTVYGKFCAATEYIESKGAAVYTASDCYYGRDGASRQYWLDDGQTLSMNILYNYYYEHISADENNHSVVTLFTKTTETRKFNWLFTGDLEEDGESRLVDYYSNPANSKSEYDVLPDVDFYKAGHHGSGTSSTEKLLNVIKPEIVAISCCAGAPEYTSVNDRTFPYADVFKNLLKHTDKIYCTGMAVNLPALGADGKFAKGTYDYQPCNGNIVCYFCDAVLESGAKSGNILIYGTNSTDTVLNTDWYKTYRRREGEAA